MNLFMWHKKVKVDILWGSGPSSEHRDEGQSLWLQSLWLPNQECLARPLQAKYIGPCGERVPILALPSHQLSCPRTWSMGLRYTTYHPFITFHKKKAYNFSKLSFLNHEESFLLRYAKRTLYIIFFLSFYDDNKTSSESALLPWIPGKHNICLLLVFLLPFSQSR